MIHRLAISGLILLAVYCSANLIRVDLQQVDLKEDQVELLKVKYGLFNVDEWKRIAADVITQKIESFNLEEGDRRELRKKINGFLTETINEFEERYYEENSSSIRGVFKNAVAGVTGTFKQLKKDIPTFTEQILDFLDEPENREALKRYLHDKVNEYADNTFADTDYSLYNEILLKYEAPNKDAAILKMQEQADELMQSANGYKYGLYGSFALFLLIIILVKNPQAVDMLLFVIATLAPLVTGLTLPMIEIDARIAELSFTLLGEPVSFMDQVLYYRSKSILEVVELMFAQGKAELLFIGFLVLLFSVIFPLSKLIMTVFYVFRESIRSNKIIHFFVIKSSKWSMADVMVVAIFMSYIGFSGLINEQLQQLEQITRNIDIISTNQSKLLDGFYCFGSFVILSLFVSQKVVPFDGASRP